MVDNRTRYEGIDGLKAYAIIGIALMHVLANGEYSIGGFVFERLIPSFTNLVFLFMMVSGFGMCCGYYQKIIDQKISVEDFYKKRYIKIWPYFTLLCALDFMMSPSKESLFEVFANLTLCQGLLPNANIRGNVKSIDHYWIMLYLWDWIKDKQILRSDEWLQISMLDNMVLGYLRTKDLDEKTVQSGFVVLRKRYLSSFANPPRQQNKYILLDKSLRKKDFGQFKLLCDRWRYL